MPVAVLFVVASVGAAVVFVRRRGGLIEGVGHLLELGGRHRIRVISSDFFNYLYLLFIGMFSLLKVTPFS